MKQLLRLLAICIPLALTSAAYAEIEQTQDIVTIAVEDNLADLKQQAIKQVELIECILTELSKKLETAHFDNYDLVCREINFLREYIHAIRPEHINSLSIEGLAQLLIINEMLINHLADNVGEDLSGFCNFNPRKSDDLLHQRKTLSTDELYERYNKLHNKIQDVWNQVAKINFVAHAEDIAEQVADTVETAYDSLYACKPAAVAAAGVSAFCALTLIAGLKRGIAYTALPLYLLRSKSRADVTKQMPSLLWLKDIVGSSEKAYAVAYSYGDDLGELKAWQAEQEKKHNITIKICKEDNNDFNFLKNFSIGIEDGYLIKISLQALFLSQLHDDYKVFTGWADGQLTQANNSLWSWLKGSN